MTAIATVLGWGFLAAAVSFLSTRLIQVILRAREHDADSIAVICATGITAVACDLLLFQGDLLNKGRWGSDHKGGYLWYMLPIASVFFLTIAGITSSWITSLGAEKPKGPR